MAYATVQDIEARITLSEDRKAKCAELLDDAAIIIDSYNKDAEASVKKLVSCRMVIRAIGNDDSQIPIGASQGSMSALGYVQSWTMSTSGATGELYLAKLDKKLLGVGDRIGASNPYAGGCLYD